MVFPYDKFIMPAPYKDNCTLETPAVKLLTVFARVRMIPCKFPPLYAWARGH